jgi:carbonic anhydrase
MRTTHHRPLSAIVGLGLLSYVLMAQAASDEIRTSPRRVNIGMPSDVQASVEAVTPGASATRPNVIAAPVPVRTPPAAAHGSAPAPLPLAVPAPAAGPLKKPYTQVQTTPEGTMDALRQRLAEKLGAQTLPESSDPHLVRVVANPAPTATPTPVVTERENELIVSPAKKPRAAVAAKSKAPPGHWDYEGDAGPQNWAAIKPEFSKCGSGTRQSPIDIRDGISVQLDPVVFDYKPSAFRVIDNGHTVQVNVAPGNSIEVMNRRFELVQFHFHRPSEERINGRQFDMVAHLVHKDLEGRLAVVAVLLDRGSVQPVVQMVWNNLPLEKGEELAARTDLDLNQLLPSERGYFTYMGSLTTPPCSEGVLWMVMKNPVQISSEQIGIFSRMYPMNARPVQSTSGRMIKGSAN